VTAVLNDDVVEAPPRPPIGGGDPLVETTVRLLSIPVRQLYAVLWRLGLIEVR
jgi:hypothetical protein